MVIVRLATPYDPGDLDPGVIYDYVEIRSIRWDLQRQVIRLELKRGTFTSGFVPGRLAAEEVVLRDRPRLPRTDYTDLLPAINTFGIALFDQLVSFDSRWTRGV